MLYLTESDAIKSKIAEYTCAKVLWVDTEVADFKTKKPRLSLIQVLDNSVDIKGDRVSILDVLESPDLIDVFIEEIMINPDVEKVFHNASYDLTFLGKTKAKNITCTLKLAEKIPYYLLPLPNLQLKVLAKELCHFQSVSNLEQTSDWDQRPLTENQLNYAKFDPVYVAQVHHRLLQLTQLIHPDPQTEDINLLSERYQEIEHQWKLLNTEITDIKDRIKAAMQAQNLTESNFLKLSSYQRSTKKVSFKDLAKLAESQGLDIDLSITLSQQLQKELKDVIDQLPIQVETTTISQLKAKESDDTEDLPF